MNYFISSDPTSCTLRTIVNKNRVWYFMVMLLLIGGAATAQPNLVWNQPGKDFHDAIPLGNGDIGISAWAEENGRLKFYLAKTDSYDDNNRLLKIGLVSIQISPNPFAAGKSFTQELSLKKGEMTVSAGGKEDHLTLHLWVDANQPVIHVELTAQKLFSLQVHLENWRKEERIITDTSFSDAFSNSIDKSTSTFPAIQYPDIIMKDQPEQIVWYHQNKKSCWPNTLKLQGIGELTKTETDPLQDRIFGGAIFGKGLIKKDDTTLISNKQVNHQEISIVELTSHPATPAGWLKALTITKDRIKTHSVLDAFNAHQAWWEQFWNRSWINIETVGDSTGAIISRSYALQRWLAACGGRGKGWVKFNGSIFTLPWEKSDPDYRTWGSANWFQNVRLVYWPMIASGDFDMIAHFYGTYLDALPLTKERTKKYYGHGGAFFSETSYAWGTYTNADYGYNRQGLPTGFATNTYIHYYWTGGLELSAMMLDQYAVTNSHKFLSDTLLPLVSNIIEFYDKHWKNGKDGKINFDPAQSLETWQISVNPLPEIAGLKYVIGRLLELHAPLINASLRSAWIKTLSRLPDVPVKTVNDSTYLLPAVKYDKHWNVENPELYAVFPYRLYGVGRPNIQTGSNSFAARVSKASRCWWQDEIQAACLGLTDQAKDGIIKRMSDWNKDFRFPAMWGPNDDELPDLDHGGSGQTALQNMLLQSVGDSIFLFPAWPVSWDVNFRLYAPKGTLIDGELRGGKLQKLVVTPKSRYKDIIVPAAMGYVKQ